MRRAKGLTQAQLAELIGKSTDAVSQIERGINQPSTATLRSISFALSVPVEELMEGYLPETQTVARKKLMAQGLAILSGFDDSSLATAVELLIVLKRAGEK